MFWNHNRTDFSYAASRLFKRQDTRYKIEAFERQYIIFLVLIVHFIYITGITGNVLTLIVMQKKSMQDNFVSVFLSAMCVVDLWCLCTGFYAYWWMSVSGGKDLRDDSYTACFYHWYVTLMGLQINEWLIVLVSACRIHVIVNRASRSKRHENRIVSLLILGVMFGFILVPGYFMVRDGITATFLKGAFFECDFLLGADLRLAYFTITHFLPPLIVVAENYIMHCFYRRGMPAHMRQRPANIAANQRMKMLIVMTDAMFFVTSVPPLVFYELSKSFLPPENKLVAANRKFEMVLMFTVLYGGFAFNVIVYCCFGRRFRSELKMLLLKPFYSMGFFRETRIRESGSIRHPEPMPFSLYTSSGSNQCEFSASVPGSFVEKRTEENDGENLEPETSLCQVEKKSADGNDLIANSLLRNRSDEDGHRPKGVAHFKV